MKSKKQYSIRVDQSEEHTGSVRICSGHFNYRITIEPNGALTIRDDGFGRITLSVTDIGEIRLNSELMPNRRDAEQ